MNKFFSYLSNEILLISIHARLWLARFLKEDARIDLDQLAASISIRQSAELLGAQLDDNAIMKWTKDKVELEQKLVRMNEQIAKLEARLPGATKKVSLELKEAL